MSRGHAVKARCPHGSPWYVECWSCADEVIAEHEDKVVELFPYAINLNRPPRVKLRKRMFPRGCEPPDEPFADCPFFSATPGPTTTFDFSKCEPLTPESFLRARTQWFQTLFGRHLTSVK